MARPREIIVVSRQTPSDYSKTVQQKSYIENRKVPADVILVSMDVTSPQEKGIHTVCRAYETFYINEPPIPTQLQEQYPTLEYNSKPLKHSIVKCILVYLNGIYRHIFIP